VNVKNRTHDFEGSDVGVGAGVGDSENLNNQMSFLEYFLGAKPPKISQKMGDR